MTVDEKTPPPLPNYGTYWERTSDPFHIDSMPDDMKNVPPENVIVIGSDRKGFSTRPRKEGWMLIDWCENAIGWVADGETVDGEPQEYTIKQGPYGHPCAYSNDRVGAERMKDHEGKDWRSQLSRGANHGE
jgi:hypothetical protein